MRYKDFVKQKFPVEHPKCPESMLPPLVWKKGVKFRVLEGSGAGQIFIFNNETQLFPNIAVFESENNRGFWKHNCELVR